ncbi:MAG TPA: SulP family inorganic anion transporter, partial [Methylocystis sp.]
MNNDEEKQWPLFRSFQGVGLSAFLRFDLVAGLTLAAIAIPTQMATARLGGFAPDIGFFAFIAGSTAFAAFGSNRFLSAGADSTIMPIFAGSLALLAPVGLADYSELAATLALLVGLILVLAGVFRAGWVADLLSIPVVTGFLAGIAIHIAVSQAPSLLGLPGGEGEVFHRLALISHDIGKTNFLTLAIGASCLACIVLCEIISPRIPGALIALAGATFVVAHFDLEARRVAVIGAVKFAPPHPSIPMPSLGDLTQVIGLAAIISVIVMVQTAATSRSFPGAPGEAPDV